MKIWITRHGQTDYNKKHLMQGRTDAPLNETGIHQAKEARAKIGDMHFDAVYASPLQRAKKTASIIGDVPEDQIIIDQRLTEVDFGRYEMHRYECLGPKMTFYWLLPEFLPSPATVEPLSSMIARSSSFLQDLEKKDYDNVLVVCHGGIMRTLCGYLKHSPKGIMWRPKPHNCEIRVFDTERKDHPMIKDFR